MCRKKTFALTLAFLSGLPHSAQADGDYFRMFASCAGRLSAEIEHSWLTQRPGTDILEDARDAFVSLAESVSVDADDDHRAMSWRLNAKVAQAELLKRATFNSDAASAEWASKRADALASSCLAIVLQAPEERHAELQSATNMRNSLN